MVARILNLLMKQNRLHRDKMATKLFELRHEAGHVKGKKTQCRAKKLETRVAELEVKTDNSYDKSLFIAKKPKNSNINNLDLDRNQNGIKQSQPGS